MLLLYVNANVASSYSKVNIDDIVILNASQNFIWKNGRFTELSRISYCLAWR